MSGKKPSRAPDRLAARKKRARRRVHIFFAFAAFLFLLSLLWLLWRPWLRIQTITVLTGESALADIVRPELSGSYLGIIPRNSILFYSERAMRARLLAERPDLTAVSIGRSGFTALELRLSSRVPLARWCGLEITEGVEPYCYLFDSSGYLFAAADTFAVAPLYPYTVYAPLSGATEEPLKAVVMGVENVSRIFDFAGRISTLGSTAKSVVLTGDEVRIILENGARVIYVRGQEEQAAAALHASKDTLSLEDDSVEYVDARFEGKVYVKRKGDTVAP